MWPRWVAHVLLATCPASLATVMLITKGIACLVVGSAFLALVAIHVARRSVVR